MKINLKKLFVTAIIGMGVFVSQPAQAFYYDMSDSFNYTNNVINSTRNYLLSSEVISHIKKGDYSSKKNQILKKQLQKQREVQQLQLQPQKRQKQILLLNRMEIQEDLIILLITIRQNREGKREHI